MEIAKTLTIIVIIAITINNYTRTSRREPGSYKDRLSLYDEDDFVATHLCNVAMLQPSLDIRYLIAPACMEIVMARSTVTTALVKLAGIVIAANDGNA